MKLDAIIMGLYFIFVVILSAFIAYNTPIDW